LRVYLLIDAAKNLENKTLINTAKRNLQICFNCVGYTFLYLCDLQWADDLRVETIRTYICSDNIL